MAVQCLNVVSEWMSRKELKVLPDFSFAGGGWEFFSIHGSELFILFISETTSSSPMQTAGTQPITTQETNTTSSPSDPCPTGNLIFFPEDLEHSNLMIADVLLRAPAPTWMPTLAFQSAVWLEQMSHPFWICFLHWPCRTLVRVKWEGQRGT